MDENPIQHQQRFLDPRGKMLESISSIRSTLGSFSSDPLSTLTLQSSATYSAGITQSTSDAYFQRLWQALQEMQAQIEQRVRPALQRMIQSQVDQLRRQSDEQMAALRTCLSQIDRSVLQCSAGLEEYQKRYANLDQVNKDLARLGVLPESLPEKISVDNLRETISARMKNLDIG